MTRGPKGLRLGIAAGMLAAAFAASAVSAQSSNLKIGVVDVAKLLQQSPQAQAAMQALQKEFAPRQRDLVAKQNDLQEKQETYKRDRAVMSDEERTKLEREIRDQQRDLQRADNEFREDLNLRQNEEVGKVQKALLQQVQDYARNADYDLVVADALFFSDAVDITEEVLATLKSDDGGSD
jgi:outer membrane protein